MKSLETLKNLSGKTVLLRVDFNVPFSKNKVLDQFRIQAVLPTIAYLLKQGATIVIISHAGDDGVQSLAPITKILNKTFPTVFVNDFRDAPNMFSKKIKVVLCENIRREKGEKKNTVILSKALASIADIYVNDAFPVSHRVHASIVGIPKFLPSYAGLQMEKEISRLSQVLQQAQQPFIFLLGGAKFDTKMPLIQKFLSVADYVFVGGALANNFFQSCGYEIGKSLVDPGYNLVSLCNNKKLLLPIDVVVWNGKKTRICAYNQVHTNETIVDIGIATAHELEKIVKSAKTVLWNGPFGKYENLYGKNGTQYVLKALSKNKKCFSVIGGGDIVAVVHEMKLQNKFSFVSTGGGATLEFLTKETLPGIDALNTTKKKK